MEWFAKPTTAISPFSLSGPIPANLSSLFRGQKIHLPNLSSLSPRLSPISPLSLFQPLTLLFFEGISPKMLVP